MTLSLQDLPLVDCEYAIGSGSVHLRASHEQMEITREHLRCWATSDSTTEISRPLNSTARRDINMESAALERDIEKLLEEMKQLHSKLQVKEIQIRKNKSLLSPIRNIPPELLQHILSKIDPPMLPDNDFVLQQVMLVCHLWKRTVKCIPQLWSHIKLTSGRGDSFEYVTRMLQRKTAYPLVLTGYITQAVMDQALRNLLMSSKHLWGGFTFTHLQSATDSATATSFLEALSGSESLSHLRFGNRYGDNNRVLVPFVDPPANVVEFPTVRNLVLELVTPVPLPIVHLPGLQDVTCVEVCFGLVQLEVLAGIAKTAKCMTILSIKDRQRDTVGEWKKALKSPPEFPNILELALPLNTFNLTDIRSIKLLTVIAGCRSLVSLHTCLFEIPVATHLVEMPTLELLRLHITDNVSKLHEIDRWSDWMRVMPRVTTLHIQLASDKGGGFASSYTRRIINNLQYDNNFPYRQLSCPALTSLVYEKWHFGQFYEENLKYVGYFAYSHSRQKEPVRFSEVEMQAALGHPVQDHNFRRVKSRPYCSITVLDYGKHLLRNASWEEYSGWMKKQDFEKAPSE